MVADKKNLLLFYDRPLEPSFMPKGPEEAVFEVPNNFLRDRHKPIGVQLASYFVQNAKKIIHVKKITPPPINDIEELDRRSPFSVLVPRHQHLAARMIDIFLEMESIDDLQAMCVYCFERINPLLFNYALSVALLHRPDTSDLHLPSLIQSFPAKFLDSTVFAKAREEVAVIPKEYRIAIEIPREFTASELEVENRLAYFREDLGINLHHWHWHLVYPFEGRRDIVAKDRRGELFYYMHQQIIARYNAERMCNKLLRVKRFVNWQQPIDEGYFPKLDSLVASRTWPARVPNSTIQDLDREDQQIKQNVTDMIRWSDRILEAIHSRSVRTKDGQQIELGEVDGVDRGIDILGNMIEASPVLSPNPEYYGNLHNMGHLFIAYCHDPDHKYLENSGVMGDSATAMRDPVFYKWHLHLDDIFQKYKATIPRYTVDQLEYQNITIPTLKVRTEGEQPNVLQTFWQQSDVDLSRGLDFAQRGKLHVRFTHLQHKPFSYIIQVNNSSNSPQRGTVRIFIAPKFNERSLRMKFRDHRLLFIELDKFTWSFDPGNNEVIRRSNESSVTIPFERIFPDPNLNRPVGDNDNDQFKFCGCGWPEYMLIPKGTAEGYPCVLFVMVSNIAGDLIEQDVSGPCNNAPSYCGIKDKRYPDKRSMGYPFDRVPRDNVTTLEEFLTPNMKTQDIMIRFTDRTVVRGQ